MNTTIAGQRLQNQCITRTGSHEPADVVAWLGAVQAQEYPAARWGLGLRMPEGTTDSKVERAVDEGRILRTHVMRPTWHFVTPSDIRWILELTAPRVHRAMAHDRRQHGLETAILTRAATIFERSLGEGRYLTRPELGRQLGRDRRLRKVPDIAKGIALALRAIYAELEGIVCSGPSRGKQPTYALLADRAPQATRLSRDEALAELTRRYFTSHGPAIIRDFVWWSGLTSADAKRGPEMNRARHDTIEGRTYWTVGPTNDGAEPRHLPVHLLPVYDEYLVGYRDREAVPHGPPVIKSPSGASVRFQNALVIAGQVAGTWRTIRKASGLIVNITPLRRVTRPERHALDQVAASYGRFLDAPVSVAIAELQ